MKQTKSQVLIEMLALVLLKHHRDALDLVYATRQVYDQNHNYLTDFKICFAELFEVAQQTIRLCHQST